MSLHRRRPHKKIKNKKAKIKIFKDGLGLDPVLLSGVKLTFNKCPVVTYKLHSKINVATSIKNKLFNFTRTYHSKGKLKTDTIDCKILGIEPPRMSNRKTQINQTIPMDIEQCIDQHETLIKIDGCDSKETAKMIKQCLSYYGETLTEITENIHYDPDPNAQPVGYGKYQIKMRLLRQIPNFIPAAGKKIISYQ